MKVTGIKTHAITTKDNLFAVFDKYLPDLQENSVVAITSKIISICEGRVVSLGSIDKDELIKQESQFYLPRSSNKYNVSLTVTQNILAASSGIDESNGNGYFVLWPKEVQKSANTIRSHLQKKFNLSSVGIIITDSKTTPLRWGVTGFSLAHSGFAAVNSYIGKRDLFGRRFEYEKVHVADSLAASAVIVMGEGAEQTPLSVITDVPFVEFQDRNPLQIELDEISITMEDDIYAPLLVHSKWRKGRGNLLIKNSK